MEAPAPPTTAPRCGAVVFYASGSGCGTEGLLIGKAVPRVFKRIRVTYGAAGGLHGVSGWPSDAGDGAGAGDGRDSGVEGVKGANALH